MAMPQSSGVDARAIQRFNDAFQRYLTYNKRDLGPLIESRAHRLRFGIFSRTKDIAPSAAQIESDFKSRNFAIRRKQKADGKLRTIKEELAARKRSRMFLAQSWRYPGWQPTSEGRNAVIQATSRDNGSQLGRANIRTSKGTRTPTVSLQSHLEGMVIQNAERKLVDAAINDQIGDMQDYIRRKQQQEINRRLHRNFNFGRR